MTRGAGRDDTNGDVGGDGSRKRRLWRDGIGNVSSGDGVMMAGTALAVVLEAVTPAVAGWRQEYSEATTQGAWKKRDSGRVVVAEPKPPQADKPRRGEPSPGRPAHPEAPLVITSSHHTQIPGRKFLRQVR